MESSTLKSLHNFKPQCMSLVQPHLLWVTCGSNPFEIHKAVIQARMLSGRYVTDELRRHWTTNQAGACTLPSCTGHRHLLLLCPSLNETRNNMVNLARRAAATNNLLAEVFNFALSCSDPSVLMQFLLDCSVMPQAILLKQNFGIEPLAQLFPLSRSWCYSIHRSRMRQLGLFNYI